MGCSCQKANKNPEDKEVYEFFNQMYRSNAFSFKIDNYDSLIEQITKKSANNFKKLEKKQDVRIGFIHHVTRLFNTKNSEKEKDEHNIGKLMFFILVLNITLKKFLEESAGTPSLKQQNDIEQSLMSICVNALNKQYSPINNLGLITFYVTKLMTLLIDDMKDIDNYLSIDKYVNYIKIIEDNKVIKEEEKFQYNVTIGLFFGKFITKSKTAIQKQTLLYIINFYINSLFHLREFIIGNYDNLKENNDNLQGKNNYIEFKSLCSNHFLVFHSETRDVAIGKSLLSEMELSIKKLFTEKNENSKMMELLLIEMFRQCSSSVNKILITAMFEFLCDKITKDTSLRFYYDILCSYCQLIVTDEILNERCMRLFALIFIEEITIETSSNSNSIKYRENMFVDKLCESIFINLGSQKVFFSFLGSVSDEYKELENSSIKSAKVAKLNANISQNVLDKLTRILDKYFQTLDIKTKQDFSIKGLFILIKKFFSNDQSLKTGYAKFYESLINFAMRFFNFNFEEFKDRKSVLNSIISFIYDFEILAHNGENLINNIISFMATLQSFIGRYSKGSFQDAYLLFKLLSFVFRQYNKEMNVAFTYSSIYFVYQIGMGILCIMKNVFQLPISLSKIHSEVYNGLKSINTNLATKLNDTITSYSSESEVFYSELKNKIATNFKIGSPTVSYELFSQFIDLIYSKVFGYSSSLNSFFEGEMRSRQLMGYLKEINEDNCLWDGISILRRKDTEIITEGNITLLLDNADDINDFSGNLGADDRMLGVNHESFYVAEVPEGSNKPNTNQIKKAVTGCQMGELDDYYYDNDTTNKLSKVKL